MRSTVLACLTVSALALAVAGCGGSDDDDGIGEQQQRVVDLLLSGAGEVGIELDDECVSENVAELSDDDAKAIADAGLEGEADISDEGDAIGDTLFSDCVDAESYANAQVESIGEIDETVDVECLREALDGLTVDEIDEQLIDAATGCSTGG